VHASAYPLAACIFGFQNCWSPFLAEAELNKEEKQKITPPKLPPQKKKPAPIMSAC